MSYESEIKKLERRWEENPKQYFAPLAEAYRKNGDYGKALDLIAEGLGERPNYVSAHIVLGRTRVDMGDFEEAARVFEQVLEFDAENIIALNQLAELTEKGGDLNGAVGWLERLLEVDPMDDQAQAHLAQLKGDQADQTGGDPDFSEIEVQPLTNEPDAAGGDEPFIDTSFAGVLDEPDAAAAPQAAGGGEAAVEQPSTEREKRPALDEVPTSIDMNAIVIDQPEETEEPAALAETGGHVETTEPAEAEDTVAATAETPPAAAEDPGEIAEIPTMKMAAIEVDEEPKPDGEVSEPVATPVDGDEPVPVPEESSDRVESDASRAAQTRTPDGSEAVSAEEPDAGSDEEPQPEPIVTETMARVYAQQGMIGEAVDVYRKLIELNPSDERLAAELQRLETSAEPREKAAPAPRYSVVVTGGTSARGLLREILSAKIAPGTAAPPPREPFAAPQAAPSASRLSFDDFYGATGETPPTDSENRSDSPGDDDFKSWLKGLKS